MSTTIIGIDCATVEQRVGLALGTWDGVSTRLSDVTVGHPGKTIAATILGWILPQQATLLAIDAPLGWPALLGQALGRHEAGQPLEYPANQLFRRETDRWIRKHVGRQPLDVGADRIARTAHAALGLLEDLRRRTGCRIPLAWRPKEIQELAAIEVYPAATLVTRGLPASGYKGKTDGARRQTILDGLSRWLLLPPDPHLLLQNADALDAAVCVLAGSDFLQGLASPPADSDLAGQEGWIWVYDPGVS